MGPLAGDGMIPCRPLEVSARGPALKATVSASSGREERPSGQRGLGASGSSLAWVYMFLTPFSQPASRVAAASASVTLSKPRLTSALRDAAGWLPREGARAPPARHACARDRTWGRRCGCRGRTGHARLARSPEYRTQDVAGAAVR